MPGADNKDQIGNQIDETQIYEILLALRDDKNGQPLISREQISGMAIKERMVQFSIDVNPDEAEKFEPVRQRAEAAVRNLCGVLSATALLTAEKPHKGQGMGSRKEQQNPRSGNGKNPKDARKGHSKIRHIIAVASGKGGVGKSTTAVNLALALKENGQNVGLMDADVYGPSLPRMLGIKGRPDSPDGKVLLPMEKDGLKAMSIGFLVAEDQPVIWRGPMVMGALQQMLNDVLWGELDILVVDMPPGTGDAQLSMAQNVPLAGAIIVSTPQDIALLDARKGLNMFYKTDVPVLGIVENMSLFICPACGAESHIFGHGGARAEAQKLQCPFLGEIPLHMDIRTDPMKDAPSCLINPIAPRPRLIGSSRKKFWRPLRSHPTKKLQKLL